MTIHYFNPDNDLALANGGPHYTATPRAEQLRRDLQLLPCWLAKPGDVVLCDDISMQSWVDNAALSVVLINRKQLVDFQEYASLRPWGWNGAMRWRLMHWGVGEEYLPTSEQIERWRLLAHRRTTIMIHKRVGELLGAQPCPVPVECNTLEQVVNFARNHPGCYVKAPWSGSGRGILRAIDPNANDFLQRVTGTLQRQGSVLCETALQRTLDFAVEMECKHGNAYVTGYSVFNNDFHSQYSYGIVGKSSSLRNTINKAYAKFDAIELAVIQSVNQIIAPEYDGPLGVDMLLFLDHNGTVGINPCVELNLRSTMGHITAALGERHNYSGRFRIVSIDDVLPGDIQLTPINSSSHFCAVIHTEW